MYIVVSLKSYKIASMKGAPKHDRVLAVFIFSDNLELVASLNFEPITSAVMGKCITAIFVLGSAQVERHMNQLLLPRRIMQQTLWNLMLFATPNLTC